MASDQKHPTMTEEADSDSDESPLNKTGSSNIPVVGAHCGIRPDPEEMEHSDAIDFSKAKDLLDSTSN